MIAIFGCGPAGLLTAWAAERADVKFQIFSIKRKSDIPGSQYLHGPIPGITSPYPEGTVQYIRVGTAECYARKVYGDENRETGWDNYYQVYASWNVHKAYERLWEKYRGVIIDSDVRALSKQWMFDNHDMVISTVPAQMLCRRDDLHRFEAVPYYIRKLPTPKVDAHHDIVVYNGLPDDGWYRWSILGGVCSVEATSDIWTSEPVVLVTRGVKAISNNCDCWPSIKRIGRWAKWQHGVLLHDSFHEAEALMETLT